MKRTAKAMAIAAALVSGCITTDNLEQESAPKSPPTGLVRSMNKPAAPKSESFAERMTDNGIQRTKAEFPAKSDPNIRQVNGSNGMPVPMPIPGVVAAPGAIIGPGGPGGGFGMGGPPAARGCRTNIRFVGPNGMKVAWFNGQGPGGFSPTMVEVPGRYNFPQGGAFRLKLTDLPNRPGVELYPTLEVIPANSKSATFLAHSAVPIGVTEEDLEQVASGNFIVKVIYLPDPAYQDLAIAGPDEIVSSRLEPGVDPVAEATRRGTVLLIFRLGNIDLEGPNSPKYDAPPPGTLPPGAIPGHTSGPAMVPPGGRMAQR